MRQSEKITAIYCRLSREDKMANEGIPAVPLVRTADSWYNEHSVRI